MRILFFGMNGPFTRVVLDQLLTRGLRPVAVLISDRGETGLRLLEPVPAAHKDPLELPLLDAYMEPGPMHLAWAQNVPVYACGPLRAPSVLAFMRDARPDVACVACFDRKFPQMILNAPRLGVLNVHPSRLPAYRGPEPLFWQLRDGVNPLGVTIHWMDEGLDTGDLAAQSWVTLPDGAEWSQVEALAAQASGELLARVLAQVASGTVPRTPQPPGGSYQPVPTEADFTLSLDWTARRAFNFMRGVAAWGYPFRLEFEGEWLSIAGALAWEPDTEQHTLLLEAEQGLWVRFRRGRVLVRRISDATEQFGP